MFVQKADELIDKHFSEKEMKILLSRTEVKKSMKRLEKIVSKLKVDARLWIEEHNPGVYGRAKLVQQIQSRIYGMDFDDKTKDYVINRLLM